VDHAVLDGDERRFLRLGQPLAGLVQTVFRGTTLRGLLLNAYAFWKMGETC
jgi:hypothetical protein